MALASALVAPGVAPLGSDGGGDAALGGSPGVVGLAALVAAGTGTAGSLASSSVAASAMPLSGAPLSGEPASGGSTTAHPSMGACVHPA